MSTRLSDKQTFGGGWFHFCALPLLELLFSSVTHYFTFINLTHQSGRRQGRMQEVAVFVSAEAADGMDRFRGELWRLFSHPEIKLSAAGPVPHC